MIDEKTLYRILPSVERPGRYIGGEVNAVRKPFDSVDFRFAFAFPDTYEIGMSHLGLQILYGLVNARADSLAERVFMPWSDMEAAMRAEGIPLFSLESRRPVADFDCVGFSLQYEVCYPTVLRMLDLAGIPRRRAERADGRFPLVIAGGPCTYDAEPMADFVDLFFLGDAEGTLPALIDVWKAHRHEGRAAVVTAAARSIEGVYAPELYASGPSGMEPAVEGVPALVESAVVRDLENAFFPIKPVIPFVEAVHERIMLEVMRGCSRGCRFCQAGMTRRPIRIRSVARLLEQAEESYRNTGYDEISLVSLATGDYPYLLDLARRLNQRFAPLGVGLAFPSLRADTALQVIPETMAEVRKGAVTVAAEAGSERLRAVINKGITEEGILSGCENAFRAGWNRVKLYLMMGLPTETLDDIAQMGDLVDKVIGVGKSLRRNVSVNCSVAPFVPKPETPFQWEPMAPRAYLEEARGMLLARFRRSSVVKMSVHNLDRSYLEGALARGGRELGAVLDKAVDLGCFLDAWDESFDYGRWKEAFASAGIDLEAYAQRRIAFEEPLPWKHLSGGVSLRFLAAEHERAMRETLTPDCREVGCRGCGVDRIGCNLVPRE